MADGMPVLLAVILSLLIGVFVGVVNAFFIDKLKMPSLIMTLGTNAALFRKYSNQQFVKTFENPLNRYKYENYQVLLLRNHLSFEEYSKINTMLGECFSLRCVGISEFMRLYIVICSNEKDFDQLREDIKDYSINRCGIKISFSCGTIVNNIYDLFDSNNEAKILDELGYDE